MVTFFTDIENRLLDYVDEIQGDTSSSEKTQSDEDDDLPELIEIPGKFVPFAEIDIVYTVLGNNTTLCSAFV